MRRELAALAVIAACGKTPARAPDRASELLAQMTLDEKIGQLNQLANGHLTGPETGHRSVEELIAAGQLGSILMTGAKDINALQRIAIEHSRLKIPLLFAYDVIHGYRTTFPIPLAMAATWDADLVERTAAVAAREAAGDGVRWTFSPMVDVTRDPRWGRVVEGAGEDPYLGSVLAKAYVRGYQGAHLGDSTSIAACAKHFVGYGAAEAGRDYNSTFIPERELRDVYLPPFRAAVDSGVATIMTAFNTIDGVPATANPFTLGILHKEWGFKGVVVSDWNSVGESIAHGIANDAATAARKALLAGVDIDMESAAYLSGLPAEVKAGRVPVSAIDRAVRRVLKLKVDLGLFEHPYTDAKVPAPDLALAKQAALESFVLLKNDRATLPIAARRTAIALIGPFADDATDMLGSWAAVPDVAQVVTLRTALAAYAKDHQIDVAYERGDQAEAVAAARRSELVLLAVGEAAQMTGEASSRAHLDLSADQAALFDALAQTGTPIVLLVFSGRPLVLTPYVERAAAIVQVWHPGQQGGPALVDALTGAGFSGRLTVSMPRSVGQLPLYYNAFATGKPFDHVDPAEPLTDATRYKSRYLDEDNAPLFPFGYGLTYTQFEYSHVTAAAASAKALERGAAIAVHATVKNTGARDGIAVAQLYIRMRGTSVARPVRQLAGYQRVALRAGESRDLDFTLGRDQLAFWNIDGKRAIEPCALTVWVAPDARSGPSAEVAITE